MRRALRRTSTIAHTQHAFFVVTTIVILLVLIRNNESSPMTVPLPAEGNQPVLIVHNSSTAVLLLHGLTATPWELSPLVSAFDERNITVYAPLLVGHGLTPEDLERTSAEALEADALRAYDTLTGYAPRVFIVGISTGGDLGLVIASQRNVSGVVTIGAPVVLADKNAPYAPIAQHILRYTPHPVGVGEEDHYYTQYPVSTVVELYRLVDHTIAALPSVRAPVLVLQAADDMTVNPLSAQTIFLGMGSEEKRLEYIFGLGHTLIQTPDSGPIIGRIVEWVEKN